MADSDFKHASLYAQSVGISDGVLDGWMRRGLEKGVHYVVIGHQTLIHVKRVDQWISERGLLESDHQGEASEYVYGAAPSQSIPRRSKATHRARVHLPLQLNGETG